MSTKLAKFKQRLLLVPRARKKALLVLTDAIICSISFLAALVLRYGFFPKITSDVIWGMLSSTFILILLFHWLNIYKHVSRYSNFETFKVLFNGCFLLCLFEIILFGFFSAFGTPRTIAVIQPIILLICLSFLRNFIHSVFSSFRSQVIDPKLRKNILVYGAGQWGRSVALVFKNSPEIRIIGFIDDNPSLQGNIVQGINVYKNSEIIDLVSRQNVEFVAFAISNIQRASKQKIFNELLGDGILIKVAPKLANWSEEKNISYDFNVPSIEDLIGRAPVAPNLGLMQHLVKGTTILITGAGGSIGSELCRQMAILAPKKLLLLDSSELNLFLISHELNSRFKIADVEIVPILGNTLNKELLDEIFSIHNPSIVFHSAAYKHVDLVENNMLVGIENNIFGTLNITNIVRRHAVDRFVLISSDKAVHSANIMGASKRVSELILLSKPCVDNETIFCTVRFGNVLGSSGSVLQIFEQQIREGGPLTVTHPDVERYFMSIPEAAQLVIQSAAISNGGETFVLEMGKPIKILDLAKRMVTLAGFTVREQDNPNGDILINFTGLKRGETLTEELFGNNKIGNTVHERILKIQEKTLIDKGFEVQLIDLKKAVEKRNTLLSKKIMGEIIQNSNDA